MDDEIPPAILKKHPELIAVGEALRQFRAGESIRATCRVCGQTLTVESVDATGALVVRCPDGHTFFRASRTPSATAASGPDELRKMLQSQNADQTIDAMIESGKSGPKELVTEIAPFLHHDNAKLRAAAIRTLGFQWRLPEYREVAEKMWRSDPDTETRAIALMAWAGYYQHTKSPTTLRQLYQVVCDDTQPDRLRDIAYAAMFSVFGVPDAERQPKTAMSLGEPIEKGIDWAFIDRIMRESGAAVVSEAAKAGVTEIAYAEGGEHDPINGRIALTVTRDGTFELEHIHGKRRAWRGTLEPSAWTRVVAAMELDGFPVPPKERVGLVPGTQFIDIAWRRNGVMERLVFAEGMPKYRDVSRLMLTIVGEIDETLGIKPPDAPKLVATAIPVK